MTCRLPNATARVRLALLAVLLLAAPARAQYEWPVDGAPVCAASGDQHRLFFSMNDCSTLRIGWIHSLDGADSLSQAFVGALPPNGGCSGPFGVPVAATGVTEASAVGISSGIIALVPGCIGPATAAVWLQGAGSAQTLVAHAQTWFGHERQVVDDGDAPRHHPRVAPSGTAFMDTAVVVVWSDERSGVPQIRAQRVTWSGLRDWGPAGMLVAPTGMAQTDPEIARLYDGSTLVVWSDARSGGRDVYALKLLPDGSAAPGWPAGGLVLEDRPEISGPPRLAGAGLFQSPGFVAWEESGARFSGGRSIVARRLLDDGTPDPAWSALGVPLSTSPTVERMQDVTGVGSDLVAVWTDSRSAAPGNPTDLYAQWLTGTGATATGWPAAGLPVCTATGRQDAARVSASTSYAAFAWEDHRGADADVFAVLRNSDGSLASGLWLPEGLPATSAPGDQTAPVVGAGNGGGCFVAWEDARNVGTSGLDIFAQAFSAEGQKLEVPPDGVPARALLSPPRPNPMRQSSAFVLHVPRAGSVRVDIVDLAGRRVRALAHGQYPASVQSFTFDGRDDRGRDLPPGVYRVHARIGDVVVSRALIRMR